MLSLYNLNICKSLHKHCCLYFCNKLLGAFSCSLVFLYNKCFVLEHLDLIYCSIYKALLCCNMIFIAILQINKRKTIGFASCLNSNFYITKYTTQQTVGKNRHKFVNYKKHMAVIMLYCSDGPLVYLFMGSFTACVSFKSTVL